MGFIYRNFCSTWLIIWQDHCSACFLYSLRGMLIAFSRIQAGQPCRFSIPTHSSRGLIRLRHVILSATSWLARSLSIIILTFKRCLFAYSEKEQVSSTWNMVTNARRLFSDALGRDSSWPLRMASRFLINSIVKARMVMTSERSATSKGSFRGLLLRSPVKWVEV
jgi:hypothetical protein